MRDPEFFDPNFYNENEAYQIEQEKQQRAQKALDDDLIDYARSQWDGRIPRTEYDEGCEGVEI
jgi:hypothetical protein